LLSRIREKVEGLLKGVAKILIKAKFTPNVLTVLGLGLSVAAAFFYAFPENLKYFWVAAILLLFSGFCDVLDGVVARVSGRSTLFGGFLDSVVDRYSDAIVLFGITFHFSTKTIFWVYGYIWGFFAVLGSILVSYTRAKAESLNMKLEGVGLTERPERTLILIVSSIFLHPEFGLMVLAVLTNVTVVQRILYTFKQLKKLEKG